MFVFILMIELVNKLELEAQASWRIVEWRVSIEDTEG